MNRVKSILVVVTIAFAWVSVYAGNPVVVKQFINPKDWNFVENKGQLSSSEIKYYGHSQGDPFGQGRVYLYCKPGKISFVFTKVEKENSDQISESLGRRESPFPKGAPVPTSSGGGFDPSKHQFPESSKTTINRADLILLNSNPNSDILASDKQEYYENYYTTGNADSGIINVHTYKTIIYKEIYPYIDMVLHCKKSGMKYEFVVYPGGNVSDIQIQWNGLESIKKIKDSKIEYSCALGKMEESAPFSFLLADQNTHPEIESHFVLKNNKIEFNIAKYDKTRTLVIDPMLEWGTYFDEQTAASGISLDKNGNIFVVGSSGYLSNLATTGAFQTSIGGFQEGIFLAKFNSNGALLWATYYGGDESNIGNGVVTDRFGDVYILGSTGSNGLATSGSYQTINTNYIKGGFDAILVKFNTNGNRLWATYFGGNNTNTLDGSIATDHSGNIYITGGTASTSGIATVGAYQTSIGTSMQNAYLAKFNRGGKILWATYFGGNGSDFGFGVATDSTENVFISGNTTSTSGIATVGAYQTILDGGYDAFLAKFDSSGKRIWGTYFGGSGQEESGRMAIDRFGNVYISGFTNSSSRIATSGAFRTSGFHANVYLAQFNNNGSLIWATYYANLDNNMGSVSLCSDLSGNVYLTSNAVYDSSVATAGAYQTFCAGYHDAFLVKFNVKGVREWGTYYGGEEEDYGAGVVVDPIGNIYMVGATHSSHGIATKGAHQTSYTNTSSGTAFIAKFGSNFSNNSGILSFKSPIDSFCGDSQIVKVRLKNFGDSDLDSAKIDFSVNGKIQTTYNWSGKLSPDSSVILTIGNYNFSPGSDTIQAWTSMPNGVVDSFPNNDTSTAIIQVHFLPTPNAGPDTTLCYDEVYTMQGSGGVTYTWHPAVYLSSATDPNAVAILPNTEHYELVVQNSYGCIDSAPVLLKVRPKLHIKAVADPSTLCFGQPFILYSKSNGGDSLHYQYQWVNDNQSADSTIIKPSQSGWHKVILSDNCSASNGIDSVYVTVIQPAKAAFVYVPAQRIKVNQNVSFQNQSSYAAKYLWKFDINDTSNIVSPDHIYTDSGEYKITLIAYGLNHCPNDTAYGFIKIIGTQVTIYIPDAFSPNGDGINDLFNISGIGIKSYSYNIYNRWGESIFSSSSGGWNGNFKGQQVPEGVYIYMFDVVDLEGAHHYMNGNVTLMR